jgi:DNA invertase Pin-like site-specific DNA recombinase
MKYVAYLRVSTERQGRSGLGLEAQREAVMRHVNCHGKLLGEYVEVESGKHHDNRPQLQAALAQCRATGATLIVAKLDRLSRNVAFLAALMESGVEFVCADNPMATKLTVHVLAAVAEHERQMISERTRAALRLHGLATPTVPALSGGPLRLPADRSTPPASLGPFPRPIGTGIALCPSSKPFDRKALRRS